ncbi:reverse transcriptase domain-containing protein [Tanacetum coccineum]
MYSASSAVTYTSVYTDSEPGKAFWGADDEEVPEGGIPRVIVLGYDGLPIQPVAPPSPDYIPGLEDPRTPPILQDEDELTRYCTESDPEEDPEEYVDDEIEDGPVDYPMDGGDDDNGDSSRDDANDEDEDEDEEDEDEEEEEHLAPTDSDVVVPTDELVSPPEGTELVIPPPSTDITIGARISVRPQTSISLPPEAKVERLLAMTTPSPSPPISLSPPSAEERLVRCMASPATFSPHTCAITIYYPFIMVCLTQIQTLRIASTQALIDVVTVALTSPPLPPLPPSLYIPPPVDYRDDIPEFEQLPHKKLCLSTLGSKYEIRESSTARPTRDPAEAVPEIAPMTVEEETVWMVKEEPMLPERLGSLDRLISDPIRASDPPSTDNTNIANTQKGNGAGPKGNCCFECGALGHFKRDCPKLKNKMEGMGSTRLGLMHWECKKRGQASETRIPMLLRNLVWQVISSSKAQEYMAKGDTSLYGADIPEERRRQGQKENKLGRPNRPRLFLKCFLEDFQASSGCAQVNFHIDHDSRVAPIARAPNH